MLAGKGGIFALIFGSLFAISMFFLAVHKGETINALWILTVAISSYLLGYRFYARFIGFKVFRLSTENLTPAHRFRNNYDFVPTNRFVLFGHHFAAISGAGPLVGPVLAAQMGFLPATLWIVFGVIFAGAVQDMIILIISTRKGGRSLGEIISEELGKIPGTIALFGIYTILIILIAVLSLVVVKALFNSPWGTFTFLMTIPIAMVMGIMIYKFKANVPALIFGISSLIVSLIAGRYVAINPDIAKFFSFSEKSLAIVIIAYGFTASVLPVWLLMVPRDYLSTFLKVGTVFLLAFGIVFVLPEVKMPAITEFISGYGPVWKGEVFPFLFITVACGAVSGFHSLVASGTTPKLIDKEVDSPFVGYGSMLTESFVAIMALISAVTMDPGIYFAINSPASEIGKTVEDAITKIRSWGFSISAEDIKTLAQMIEEETILSRTGGAPSLAIGMALIFSKFFGHSLISFWYHFIILFEALFILTTIDTGTRIGRYILQDLVGKAIPFMKDYESKVAAFIATLFTTSLWGYFLYAGVTDPYGGIKTFWPIFGIANQLLASMALLTATAYMINHGMIKYAPIAGIPALLLSFNTITAGLFKIFHTSKDIGFLSHARFLKEGLESGILPSGFTPDIARKLIFSDYINSALISIYVSVVIVIFIATILSLKKSITQNVPKI